MKSIFINDGKTSYATGDSNIGISLYDYNNYGPLQNVNFRYIHKFFLNSKTKLITWLLVGSLCTSGMTILIKDGYDYFTREQEIAAIVDLPDKYFFDFNLEVYKDGTAMFINSEGKKFKDFNGLDADYVAKSYNYKTRIK